MNIKTEKEKTHYKLPFEMPEVKIPVFAERVFNIIDYGAVSDGFTMNTDAFAKAIGECSASGGGKVLVPEGIWLTGPIQLKSNVNLFTEKGALILFSGNFDDYPLIETSYEGKNTVRCTSPIWAVDSENIAITGYGIFDGSGEAWRPVKDWKTTQPQWEKLIKSGGVVDEETKTWWPSEMALRGSRVIKELQKRNASFEEYAAIKDFLRPVLLSFVNCRNILLDGPTFQNSPAWNLHPLMCEHVTIRNISVRNPWYAQNGDGLDIESCRYVIVHDCVFDVGDDAICLKSGKDEDGRKRGKPSEYVIIKDCTVYHGHGGFVVGSEMSGGIRNIYVDGCTFSGTDVGIRFKSVRGRGGVVEKIYINNIRMKDIENEAIGMSMFYQTQKPSELAAYPVTEETPEMRNIYINDIMCIGAEKAMDIIGLPEMPINNVFLKNMQITSKQGVRCSYTKDIKIEEISIKTESFPVIRIEQSQGLTFEDVKIHSEEKELVKVSGKDTENILFKKIHCSEFNKKVSINDEVSRDQIQYV